MSSSPITPEPTGFRDIVDPALAVRYRAEGWWGDRSLSAVVAGWARVKPDGMAFIADHGSMTWAAYDRCADRVARAIVGAGITPGSRLAVWIPDSATVHAVFVGAERAGVTIVGIGSRAGELEILHVMQQAGAVGIVTLATDRDTSTSDTVARWRASGAALDHHLIVPLFERDTEAAIVHNGEEATEVDFDQAARRVGTDDLWLVNSTSGTTGMPKCVTHFQNRWIYFHSKAAENGALVSTDVFASSVPAPYGFGIWTAHFTPTLLGAPTIVRERFDAGVLIDDIERERVSVLTCVSTQFIMLLNHARSATADLSSLRVMFTGGEAIPHERAAEFEARTGGRVLQFFGSNETGLLSGTDLNDSLERRLHTAGRVVPEMQVRLFDGNKDVTDTGRGQPGCKGPATCVGYIADSEASAGLYTDDGWMLMGDICTLDDDGYLTVVGRLSDIIIRGGKNISALQVEDEVSSHPDVMLAVAVAAPDDVFGERVCVYVELAEGATLTLDDIRVHLGERGTSKEIYPEHMVVLDQLPRSSGGKVAKGELRADVKQRLGSQEDATDGGNE